MAGCFFATLDILNIPFLNFLKNVLSASGVQIDRTELQIDNGFLHLDLNHMDYYHRIKFLIQLADSNSSLTPPIPWLLVHFYWMSCSIILCTHPDLFAFLL